VRIWQGTRAEMEPPSFSYSSVFSLKDRDMESILPPQTDDWDLERLRVPPELIGDLRAKNRPPRHRAGDPFIKGPIPFTWITKACRLPGVGLHVALTYRFHSERFRFSRGRHWGLDDVAVGLRISANSVRRGLHAAELAGLLAVEREPGCKLTVSVRDLPEPESGPKRRPLYGPIPWRWWLPASRLPGKALHVGAVCWLLAGWGRSAEFELELGDWAEFGLSRFSASRGLDELERAGLVFTARMRGRSPVVTILDVGAGPSGSGPMSTSWHPRPSGPSGN
jgi:hypothetical protein